MWKKKRYDIHIRLSPEDIVMLRHVTMFCQNNLGHWAFCERLYKLYWKIHNKCVEINKK